MTVSKIGKPSSASMEVALSMCVCVWCYRGDVVTKHSASRRWDHLCQRRRLDCIVTARGLDVP